MIVVDIGCARYGGDFSIERLVEEFQPTIVYGFDPAADYPQPLTLNGSEIIVARAAAWTYDGTIGFTVAGLGGHIDDSARAVTPCVDLARFLSQLPGDGHVLKVDAEGAEYELLEHLITEEADVRLQLAWVEWHPAGNDPDGGRRADLEERIRCPIVEWRW